VHSSELVVGNVLAIEVNGKVRASNVIRVLHDTDFGSLVEHVHGAEYMDGDVTLAVPCVTCGGYVVDGTDQHPACRTGVLA